MDILVVDDQEALHGLLAAFLEDLGYAVVPVTNGRAALSYLRRAADLPGAILLDVAMPVMTGWEVLGELQRDARLAEIPVVMMTALGRFDHPGASDSPAAYIEKPIDLNTLESILRTFVEPRHLERQIGAQGISRADGA